jgi:regulator of cell morphogenesis and NO signaling
MTITENTTIGEIATALPSSVRVFHRHGIDFCCGGKKQIGDVCRERGLQFVSIAGEVEATAASHAAPDRDWARESLDSLVGYILATYHEPLREELPRLQAMAKKVAAVHGDMDPRLTRVSAIVADLSADLHAHMLKEELVLFPAIKALDAGATTPVRIDAPIHVMEHEHDRAGALLAELRELTDGFAPPAWGCATLRALFHGLSELEASMHVHVHLENNVLFPRALRLVDGHAGAESESSNGRR